MAFLQIVDRTYTCVLFAFFILLLAVYALRGYLRSVVQCFRLRGPKAFLFIGNVMLLQSKDALTHHIGPAYERYGRLVRAWLFILPCFVVLHPDDLQSVLSSNKHTDKLFVYRLMHNFLGTGLITSNGAKWQFHRKIIQPTFHRNSLNKFIGSFAKASQSLLLKLKKAPNEINITHFINACVLDILTESVLGVPITQSEDFKTEESPFRQGKLLMPFRLSRPWLLFDRIYSMTALATAELKQKKNLQAFTRKMIRIRREAMAQPTNDPESPCLLDYMIRLSKKNLDFTENEIVDEACTFMLAGQDSVGAAVAFCLFLLAQNKECQGRCHQEVKAIFGDDQSRLATMTDLHLMQYLEQCIKETLRLYPSVPLIARRITDTIQVGEHKLAAGSNVLILPYATHRIPDIYPDPERFDPDRFTAEQCKNRSPYAFIPFSAGPRNCIGYKFAMLEMKTIISSILRQYKLMPVPGKTSVDPMFRITLRAAGGLWVRLENRIIEPKLV